MGILGRILGTDKGIDNVLDKDKGLLSKFGGFIDRQQYTEEEKAEAQHAVRLFTVDYLKALEPFKVAQRVLAFVVAFVWVFGAINVFAGIWLEVFTNIKIVEALFKFLMTNYVLVPTGLVFALYFGGGTINSLRQK